MSRAKRRQLRLRMKPEAHWDQFPSATKSHCLALLCQLLKEVLKVPEKEENGHD